MRRPRARLGQSRCGRSAGAGHRRRIRRVRVWRDGGSGERGRQPPPRRAAVRGCARGCPGDRARAGRPQPAKAPRGRACRGCAASCARSGGTRARTASAAGRAHTCRDERWCRQRRCRADAGEGGRGRGRDARALVGRRERRGAQLLLGPGARAARALAHSLDMPHFSIDLRAEFRAGVVEPWLADHASGLTPYACLRCNGSVRLDAMLELADRLGAGALATGHYARIHRDADDRADLRAGLRRPRRRIRATRLRRCRRGRSRGCDSRSGSSTSRRCAGSQRVLGSRSRASPTRRISAFSPAQTARAFSRATADSGPPRARSSTPAGESSVSTTGSSGSRSVSAEGLESVAALRASCSRPTSPRTPSRSARARVAAHGRARAGDVTLRNDAHAVDAVKIRARGARRRCRLSANRAGAPRAVGSHPRDDASSSRSRSSGPRPARSRASIAATSSSVTGRWRVRTRAPLAPKISGRDIRRDP